MTAEARVVTAAGETRWLGLVMNPLASDSAAAYLAIARDNTEARRLEDQLRQRQRLESLGVLVGGIAHDLNNIVTGVLANASFCESLVEPGTVLHDIVRDIRTAGDRARTLNASLLAYAGRAPTRIEPIDLGRVVDDTLRMVTPLIDKSVRLERVREPVAAVWGDGAQLAQVVLNLVTNAAEAIGAAEGRVLVRTASSRFVPGTGLGRWIGCEPRVGDYVALEVTDDGCGIRPEVSDRIFDPFFSTKAEGRGLGLSALLGIVSRHEGYLALAQRGGTGTHSVSCCPSRRLRRQQGAPRRTRPAPRARPADASCWSTTRRPSAIWAGASWATPATRWWSPPMPPRRYRSSSATRRGSRPWCSTTRCRG